MYPISLVLCVAGSDRLLGCFGFVVGKLERCWVVGSHQLTASCPPVYLVCGAGLFGKKENM